MCISAQVFVGSLPAETTTEDINRLFSRYGKLKSASILSMPDGRSRGCAMLLYDTWTAAEAAIDAENGSMNLGGAAGKGMVVKFADPPKRGMDGGPVVGLVPRKLFIGQVFVVVVVASPVVSPCCFLITWSLSLCVLCCLSG